MHMHLMVLMDTVVNACETGEVEIEPEARHLPKNISGTAPPSQQELVRKHQSRAGEISSNERTHRKKFSSSAAIFNFSCSGRLEREKKFYQGGE